MGRLIFSVSRSPRTQSFLSGFLHIPHLTCSTVFSLLLRNLFLSHFKFLSSFLPCFFHFSSPSNPFIYSLTLLLSLLFRDFIEHPRHSKRSFCSHITVQLAYLLHLSYRTYLRHAFSLGRYHTLILPLITFTNASSMTTNS